MTNISLKCFSHIHMCVFSFYLQEERRKSVSIDRRVNSGVHEYAWYCSATQIFTSALFVHDTEAVDAEIFHSKSRASRGEGIF